MATILVATASVHTTAAACDYLAEQLNPDDVVVILGVSEPDHNDRDLADAANVARSRLVHPSVETETRAGEPAETIVAVAQERNADAVIVGATVGDPARAGDPPGSTVRDVIATAERPVTVLPSPAP